MTRGNSVPRADAGGYLVIRRPWPAMLRTIWGDNERYLSTYWEKFQNRYYVAGDSAHRDKDGYFWIMGRIDDVLNVAGHRLGTMEIESALVSHPRVAEAAVVGRPHDVKGESVFAFVVCRGDRPAGDMSKLVDELRKWVSQELGAIARPDDIRFADNLPKTRSGKIMRRLLRSVARGDEITQDVSTLENPGILDQLRGVDRPPTEKVKTLKSRRRKRQRRRRPPKPRKTKQLQRPRWPSKAETATGKAASPPKARATAGKNAGRKSAATEAPQRKAALQSVAKPAKRPSSLAKASPQTTLPKRRKPAYPPRATKETSPRISSSTRKAPPKRLNGVSPRSVCFKVSSPCTRRASP